MHPKFAGDPHDIVKLSIMEWLDPDDRWLIHPMYFPLRGEIRDHEFPGRIAHLLRANLVTGDIWHRPQLVDAAAADPGHLFLDPDTGVLLDNAVARRKVTHLHVDPLNAYVYVRDVVAAARCPLREKRLNQYQGGMCISGVLKTTERTLQHFISPSGPNWVTTESAVSDMYISPWL